LNDVRAIDSEYNEVEVLQPNGSCVLSTSGTKSQVADAIIATIQSLLISPTN